jgi:hypothetical protein
VGAAVRLRISAEAAAGVTLDLGLKIGDFIELVEDEVGADTLAAQLFLVFLEEASLGGGIYAKVAASAMAYATLVVAGRAIKGTNPGEDPGFSIIAEYGAGFKAGAGYRLFFKAGINNFPRFIGRSIDLFVDETFSSMGRLMPANVPEIRVLNAFKTPAKIALRLAFEMGYLIASESVPTNAAGGRKISLRACQVILEECQRYLLDCIVGGAIDEIRRQIDSKLVTLNPGARESALPKIHAFGSQLLAIPAEPFQLEHADYWINTIDMGAAALSAVSSGSQAPLKPAALLWSAIVLVNSAMKRIAEPSVRVSSNLAGLHTGQAIAAFTGPVDIDPPASLRTILADLLGLNVGDPILKQDLVGLLASEGFGLAQQSFPEVDDFIEIFRGPLGVSAESVIQLLMGSFGGIISSAGGVDEEATLAMFRSGLLTFLDTKVEGSLAPILRSQLSDKPELVTELDEVLLPALRLTVNLAIPQLLGWKTGTVNQSTLKEVFSSILMALVGRTLVVTADTLTTACQDRMSLMFEAAADELHRSHLASKLETALQGAGILVDLDDLEELAEDALRIGAEVFSPFPTETRAHIRDLLYDILQTLPPAGSASFQQQLETTLIPNEDKIRALATELGTIAANRLLKFAQLILLRIAEEMLADLIEVIELIAAQVRAWIAELGALIDQLQQEIAALIQEIAQLLSDAAQAFEDARNEMLSLIAGLGSTTTRNKLLDEFEGAVYDLAKPLLTDNIVYAVLPAEVKTSARQLLRDTIRTLARNGIMVTILDVIADSAGDIDDFFDDVRSRNLHEGLASSILDLLLDRIESRVRNIVGGRAGFSIGFPISWSVDVWVYDIFKVKWVRNRTRFSKYIELQRIYWDLDGLLPLLRRAITGLDSIEQYVTDVANALANALQIEVTTSHRRSVYDRKLDDRTSATHAQNESWCVPGEINIVEPAQNALYEGPILAQIRIPEVPVSFVGIGAAEQQRVFLWLNTREITKDQFSVDVLLDDHPTHVFRPGQDVGKWTPKFNPIPTGVSIMRANAKETSQRRQLPKVGKRLGKKAKPPAITGIEIFVNLPLDRLEEGANTLVVAIVNGRVKHITKSVTFLVSEPLMPKATSKQPRLEDIFGRLPDEKPLRIKKKLMVTPRIRRKASIKQFKSDLRKRQIRFPEIIEV